MHVLFLLNPVKYAFQQEINHKLILFVGGHGNVLLKVIYPLDGFKCYH
jgi:hypothetical protein